MTSILDRLPAKPATSFANVASIKPDVPVTGQGEPLQPAGIVDDATGIDGGKAAELKPLSTGSGPAGDGAKPTEAAPKQTLGHLLTAKTAIGIVDSVLPAIAVICLQYFLNVKVPKREIQLNETERAIIQIPLQNYLNSIPVNFDSPLMALLVTIGAVYGSKFAEKGFTAYFDKRDADAAHNEAMAQLKKQAALTVVKETPKPELKDLKAGESNPPPPAATYEVDSYGHSKLQRIEARMEMKKKGMVSPNGRQIAAWINRNKK